MPFMSKLQKKCNNGVDHSLHLVSSVFRVIKRQFTEFRFMSGHYQKKKKRKTQTENKYKHQIPLYISEKIIKAAFFLKSQGMAKPDSFCQENGVEQIHLDLLETGDIYMCTHQGSTEINVRDWLTDHSKGSKSNHMDMLLEGKKAYMRLFDFLL